MVAHWLRTSRDHVRDLAEGKNLQNIYKRRGRASLDVKNSFAIMFWRKDIFK